MFLTIPSVLGVDDSPAKNLVQQITAARRRVEGTLSPFTRDRLRGWLFQPADATEEVLVVPPKTKPNRIPATYRKVFAAEIPDVGVPEIELAAAMWLRHPQLGTGAGHQAVIDSWRGAFTYVEEDQENGIIGLRPLQIGAVHAVHSHWSVSDATATIVMPTGTGKTETMLSVLVSAGCSRVIVVVPSDALRTQIAEKFLTLGVLKYQDSILSEGALHPTVCVLHHIPKTVADATALLLRAHVIVTTSSLAAQCGPEAQRAFAAQCSHLFIDEAHHAEAPSWKTFKERFSARRVLQFTATPFREDGKPLDGKLIYVYPLRKAQAEGYFKPIQFVNVIEFDSNRADETIAAAAVQRLRSDLDKGHILMARVETVRRAEQVFQIYEQYPEFNPVQLHTGVPVKIREQVRRKIVMVAA